MNLGNVSTGSERANGEDKRRSPALGLNQNLCSVRFIEVLALGDRPHLPVPTPLGDRPPDTSRNLERLTQIYHCLTFAAHSEAPGTFWVDRALEEPSLGNWGRIAYLQIS